MRKDKKDEEVNVNPFADLAKSTVLQETRIFNDKHVNAKKCRPILCKLLYLLQHGETISKAEATETFFAITKLWLSKDETLRLLAYLAIKELSAVSDDVIILTSSLTKDMTGREDAFRPSAIRTLCRITDDETLQGIERYMKQAIIDKIPAVSSAALVSSLHLMQKNPDVVRRWVNEVQEAASSDNHMVQFHAIGLLYHIRSNDRLAVAKMVQKFSKSGMHSPLALCYMIRIASKLMKDEAGGGNDRDTFAFIESCLRHKSEIVIYEAASALVKLSRISSTALASAVSVLQLFCSSPKTTLRFAAVRTLSTISLNYPNALASCNIDLEQLIADPNRSIATLAITTLLKTGVESSVERLLRQIGSFVNEISDELKVVVIESIRSLCLRYPSKHDPMLNFLASMLRNEGGYEFKEAIIDTICTIINDNPSARELGLSHLCEFIEDCEHPILATRVLHLLGKEGPTTQNPARYIRFIYNRVILESAQVRASAVIALAKFGAMCQQLRTRVMVLLKRCLLDADDEVRDRATFYYTVLGTKDTAIIAELILNTLKVSATGLEKALFKYVRSNEYVEPLDIKQIPLSVEPTVEKKSTLPHKAPITRDMQKSKISRRELYAQHISAIPEFAGIGPILESSESFDLTESLNDYKISCVKHSFQSHIILQFDCRNMLSDQLLENVFVVVEKAEGSEGWKVEHTVPLVSLPYSSSGVTYVLLRMPERDEQMAADGQLSGTFNATMKFEVMDVDPTTGEPESNERYDDELELPVLEL